MAKEYWLKFGTGNPSDTSGLSPTLSIFRSWTGGVLTAPGITQPIASYGLYRFEYTPSFPIVFVADGATTGLTAANRYLTGALDPLDLVDERLQEVGSTLLGVGSTLAAVGLTLIPSQGLSLIAQGLTLTGYGVSIYAQGQSGVANFTEVLARLGTTASSYGSTSVDPGDVYGYLKRLQELQEGDSDFNKTTGTWQIETRGGTLLREKTLTNSASAVTKTQRGTLGQVQYFRKEEICQDLALHWP